MQDAKNKYKYIFSAFRTVCHTDHTVSPGIHSNYYILHHTSVSNALFIGSFRLTLFRCTPSVHHFYIEPLFFLVYLGSQCKLYNLIIFFN